MDYFAFVYIYFSLSSRPWSSALLQNTALQLFSLWVLLTARNISLLSGCASVPEMTVVIEVPHSPNTSILCEEMLHHPCTGNMQPRCEHEDTGLLIQPLLERQNYGAAAADGTQCPSVSASRNNPAKRDCLVVAILCFGNLVNFIDWFIVPGESPFFSSKGKEI